MIAARKLPRHSHNCTSITNEQSGNGLCDNAVPTFLLTSLLTNDDVSCSAHLDRMVMMMTVLTMRIETKQL